MEKDSVHSLADFEFKYIPQQKFEKIVMKVRERKAKDAWTVYCSDRDENDKISEVKAAKVLEKDEIQDLIGSVTRRDTPRTSAPLFGPARKYDVSSLCKEREKSKSPSEKSEESSDASTIHIVEEIVESPPSSQVKVQVLNRDEDDDASCNSSISEPEKSLHNEMMKLCYEIESINAGKASDNDDSSVDLSFQEEKHLRNIIDKTEEKVICETFGNVDKKFDFLYDEFKNHDDGDTMEKAQTLPAVELKPKNKKLPPDSGGDFSNDNNVWRPKAENQIRKSDVRQREKTKKNDYDVFPSDVIIPKARDVGKLKQVANEKPHVAVERQPEDFLPSKVEVLAALGRINEYQKKICQFIDYLREIVEEPPEVEDVDDLKRRQKRATEFSNRFARNHLYQIGRIAEEIRLMPDNPLDVAAKVNVLFQIIMQAIQIYLKNVEMFIYNSYPDKLLVLVDFIINATKICLDRMVFDKTDVVVYQMLRRCTGLKHFLEQNRQSLAKFTSIAEQRRKSIYSRNSFAFEVPKASKFSMYETTTQRNRRPMRQMVGKSPYDVPKVRNLRATSTNVQGRISSRQPSRMSSRQSSISNCQPLRNLSRQPLMASRQSNKASRQPQMSSRQSMTASSHQASIASTQHLTTSSRQPPTSSNKPPSRMKSPTLKKTASNVSTMMERINQHETIKTMPLDDVPRSTIPQENELREILMNVAEEKISKLLMPLIEQFKSAQQSLLESPKFKAREKFMEEPEEVYKPRVTSEVQSSPKKFEEISQKKKNFEKIERISKNVQYIYVKSEDDGSQGRPKEVKTEEIHKKQDQIHQKSNSNQQNSIHQNLDSVHKKSPQDTKTLTSKSKPPIPFGNTSKSDDEIYIKKMKALAMKERLDYIQQQSQNPLYVNEACDEPWKLVSSISDKIVDDVVENVLAGLDFGEKSFVEKFLRSELKI